MPTRTSGGSSGAATTLSWSHTVAAGENILLVDGGEASGTGESIASIVWDDGGTPQALTRKGRQVDSTAHGWAEIWYLLAPVPGTKTIKITYTAATACAAGSASYPSVDQSTPFNAASPQFNTGTGSPASLSVTSAAGETVVDSVNDNEAAVDTLVPGGGQTTIYNIENGGNNSAGSSDKAGAASVTMSWTGLNAASAWAMVGVSLRPAASAAPAPLLGNLFVGPIGFGR
jgi:hypothetical protein